MQKKISYIFKPLLNGGHGYTCKPCPIFDHLPRFQLRISFSCFSQNQKSENMWMQYLCQYKNISCKKYNRYNHDMSNLKTQKFCFYLLVFIKKYLIFSSDNFESFGLQYLCILTVRQIKLLTFSINIINTIITNLTRYQTARDPFGHLKSNFCYSFCLQYYSKFFFKFR